MKRAFTDLERLDALRLARSDGVGPVTFEHLMRSYEGPTEAVEALPDLARRAGHARPMKIVTRQEARREMDAGEALGARMLVIGEAGFPMRLAAIDGAPPVIWALGRTDLFEGSAVALVGARVASAAGRQFARSLAAGLSEAGCVVVSGMARGIDAAAHEGSIGGGTVAVLAGGVDDIYPSENRGLYERIVEAGCIVSERPPGIRAKAQDFVRRNRIISGLSMAVVVVEAEVRSGSLTTARFAGEQGRDVLAVPGSPLDPRAKGTNDLIRNGAALCEGPDDVLRLIGGEPLLRETRPAAWSDGPSEGEFDIDDLRERLAALLSPTPVSRDELVRASASPSPAVFAALMELSLAGRAELLSGGLVASVNGPR